MKLKPFFVVNDQIYNQVCRKWGAKVFDQRVLVSTKLTFLHTINLETSFFYKKKKEKRKEKKRGIT